LTAVGVVCPTGDQRYEYVGVPPEGFTVADPFGFPQVALTNEVVAVIGGGCVIVTTWITVQPFASVTVNVYVPAHNPVAVEPVPPVGDHKYE
jgi:hypothetical protein